MCVNARTRRSSATWSKSVQVVWCSYLAAVTTLKKKKKRSVKQRKDAKKKKKKKKGRVKQKRRH